MCALSLCGPIAQSGVTDSGDFGLISQSSLMTPQITLYFETAERTGRQSWSTCGSQPKCETSRRCTVLGSGSSPVFYIVTGEPFKQSAELTGEPIKMKG